MATISGMPRGGSSDWTDLSDCAIELGQKIQHDLDRLIALKIQINKAIESVEDLQYRSLLEMRYRSFWTWNRIAEAMHYDVKWVWKLHGRALQQVQIPKESIESD